MQLSDSEVVILIKNIDTLKIHMILRKNLSKRKKFVMKNI